MKLCDSDGECVSNGVKAAHILELCSVCMCDASFYVGLTLCPIHGDWMARIRVSRACLFACRFDVYVCTKHFDFNDLSKMSKITAENRDFGFVC